MLPSNTESEIGGAVAFAVSSAASHAVDRDASSGDNMECSTALVSAMRLSLWTKFKGAHVIFMDGCV